MSKPTSRALARTFAVLAILLSIATATHAGWLAGYDYRQAITVAPSVTPGNLTNFPLLVQIADPANDVFAKAAYADGHDIVFTAADGTTLLPREIEHYSATGSKELDAWVNTNLSSTAATTLYMYYRGPAVANDAATWDANYKMVQHLQEDPSGTGPQMKDSTALGNHGTTIGGMTAAQSVAGKIGPALDLDGADRVNCGNDTSLTPPAITLSGWAKADVLSSWHGIVTNIPSWPKGINLQLGPIQNIGSGYGGSYTKTAWAPTTDQWYHVAVTHDGTTGKLYVDGNLETTASRTLTYATPQPDTVIGSFYTSGSLSLNGIVDEVRVSDTPRSADWIAASFNNQNAPATYQAEAGAEAQQSGWLDGYAYRQAITLSKDAVPANLSNFPALVKLTDAANPVFAKAASAFGHDIVFTDANGHTLLPHETELYTNAAGSEQLCAWVNVPLLTPTEDTVVYMYYGGPDATPNPTAAWDSHFRMVQHLQEDPSGAGPQMKDSTAYANHGTTAGSMTSGQQVAGIIGGALNFDGNDTVNCGTDPSLYPADITLEAWAKLDQLASSWYGIVTNKMDPPGGGWEPWSYGLNLQIGPAQDIASLVGDGSGYSYVKTTWPPGTTGDPEADRWYHIVIAHDSDTNINRLYVDGVLEAVATRGLTYSTPVGATLIGAFYANGDLKFDGLLDEIRISDIARSGDWVLANYNFQFAPTDFVTFGSEQIPEPATLSLLGLGALALLRRRRR